jgi:hypothetical protein
MARFPDGEEIGAKLPVEINCGEGSYRQIEAAVEPSFAVTGGFIMADSSKNRGPADRRKVAGGQGYELSYFARKHGITREQAAKLIKEIGNDREKLNAAAGKLKK